MIQGSAGFSRHRNSAGFSPQVYEIGNDPSFDSVYPALFTHPGIVILKDFPITESRFRVLRQSFSYEEIVEELKYCIGSQKSAEQLAWFVKDDLITNDAFFLYPEVVRVVLEASIATIVQSQETHERLTQMYPHQPVFYVPDKDYRDVLNAYEYLKRNWKDPRSNFPKHLQPLNLRVHNEVRKRFLLEIPQPLRTLFQSDSSK